MVHIFQEIDVKESLLLWHFTVTVKAGLGESLPGAVNAPPIRWGIISVVLLYRSSPADPYNKGRRENEELVGQHGRRLFESTAQEKDTIQIVCDQLKVCV